ncbi:hypothetical protein GCM10010399_48640 [Dactylosporangium fulvum]|uniref:Uncharacterized protein n=1 Tax=Dactylosporangium fulvum TaxID=53359 RepID=A0ABY5VS42_9ACTN|nr:hypothetical protein [Dactylosporangium fulvum]UWP80597.1 hypothetical protein Dfulv_36330 [Dactylosporangium fulvum]
MPARSTKPSSPAADSDRVSAEESEDRPLNPLEAIRRAQASRSLPPGSGDRAGGRGGVGKGSNPKAPRKYNRHK